MPGGPRPARSRAAPRRTGRRPERPRLRPPRPAAPNVLPGKVHDIDLPIIETDITVAEGFVVHAWTFGGTVPGPTIRVHLGDTVNVHLTNRGSMSHSIDFHASQTAMNDQMIEIKPGESFTYTFTADYAGVWMYHCGTAPALHHIANGMFGMVIVEPKGGLPKVDDEFAFVQSEWYLGAQGEPADYAKATRPPPRPTSSCSTASRTSTRTTRSRSRPRGGSGSSSSTPGLGRQLLPRGRDDLRQRDQGGHRRPARQRRRMGLAGRRPGSGPGRDHRVHARSRTGCIPSSRTRSTW